MKWGWSSIINQDLISLPENFILFFEDMEHVDQDSLKLLPLPWKCWD